MVKVEGLKVLEERMRTMDPDKKEIYKFLEIEHSIVGEVMKTMEGVGVEIQFEEGSIRIDVELIDRGWKPAWKKLKEQLKKGVKNQRIEHYGTKQQRSQLYRVQEKKCHVWLIQNLKPGKTVAVMTMLGKR